MTKHSEHFIHARRGNGENYVYLAEGAPDWLQDAVRDAHDDELPNDWRYRICSSIVEAIDAGETDSFTMADNLTDCYTGDLLTWVGENIRRSAFVDDAIETRGCDSLSSVLMSGQCMCIAEMADILLSAIAGDTDDI